MAKFVSSTVQAPGASNLFEALRTHLLANGWTAHDVITATAGAQDYVFKGTALDATAGNAPFVRVVVLNTTTIYFLCYSDWETATHTGANVAGSSVTSLITVQNAEFNYLIRANSVSFYIACKIASSTYTKVYCGFLRRFYGPGKSGMTKTTAGYAAGAVLLAVASDMTGKIRVGQYIDILNHDHAAGANFANGEKVQVTSVAAGAIGCTALAKAYNTGAIVGADVYPICVGTGTTSNVAVGSTYHPLHVDGSRTSATGQNSQLTGNLLSVYSSNDPGDLDFARSLGLWTLTATTVVKTGFRGALYHVLAASQDAGLEDLLIDGITDHVTVGLNSAQGTVLKRGD